MWTSRGAEVISRYPSDLAARGNNVSQVEAVNGRAVPAIRVGGSVASRRYPEVMSPDLTFDVLVDAYFEEAARARGEDPLAQYLRLRLQLLESLFGCLLHGPPAAPPESLNGDELRAFRQAERDRQAVRWVAYRCLQESAGERSAFGAYLDCEPGPLELGLRAEHEAILARRAATLDGAHRALFRAALLACFPDLASKTFPAELLVERGLPAVRPAPWVRPKRGRFIGPRRIVRIEPESDRMKVDDFTIGLAFYMSGARWRCTDVGKRTVTAIKLDRDHDPSWYDGPPYALLETVIDEDAIPACSLTPEESE